MTDVFNATRGCLLAERVEKADGFSARLFGLMGRASPGPQAAMWLIPCRMIHTCFMRFSLDVVFLDRDQKAVRVLRGLLPWRLSPWVRGARSALEFESGALSGRVAEGDQLEFRDGK
ncbi:MAG: hypothetical protein A3G41_08135 [Elusimicrobia bacterium RIFCSPLOWO2_12_FULL_59_9]|nr:MAG: hypothetical protein A3G41_08135 [Elusimicrobia bacterium RIFCSPLOWO2_12_FULL_59_9]